MRKPGTSAPRPTRAPPTRPDRRTGASVRMNDRRLGDAAALIRDARLARRPLERLPEDLRPVDVDEAYRLQDVLHGQLEAAGQGRPAGFKIGCTTPVMQAYLRIENPCAGGVFLPTVHHGRGELPREQFVRVGVECEIAVRLARDLTLAEATGTIGAISPPSSAGPPGPAAKAIRGGGLFTREDVARAVDACFAAIEVVEDRYVDYAALGAPSLIADDFFGAGCVLGEPQEGFDPRRLREVSARMLINGKEVGVGVGTDVMGEPLDPLAWLANTLARRGRYLRAGEVVLLGSLVQTHWIERGDEVLIQNDPLGSASLLLV